MNTAHSFGLFGWAMREGDLLKAEEDRNIGIWGGLGIGVGAIVGGGVLALAGGAFSLTGPSAMLAFAANGVVALLTALSFAEMATAFPASGGAYTFARRVLTVRTAFVVGWILWFAYVTAGVLYAMGFAAFLAPLAERLFPSAGIDWSGRVVRTAFAVLAVAGYGFAASRKGSGGGHGATIGKLVVFAVIIAAGIPALFEMGRVPILDRLGPFFEGGAGGFFAAMGLTFIAFQGFDAIAAVAGEVREPRRTLPRAMILSLVTALVVYIPLLLMVSTAGVTEGESIGALSRSNPDTVIARAVQNYMGDAGWWLIIVAAILSMLSALQANVLASSSVAFSMARDHTLPASLASQDIRTGKPTRAVVISCVLMTVILLLLEDLSAAGAAASLIFLLSFTLVHATAYLARERGVAGGAFRSPWHPLIPLAGGLSCAALGVYQFTLSPSAAFVTSLWIGVGVIFFMLHLVHGAETADAHAEAINPELTRLRGRNPLVLVPVANPVGAESLAAAAATMVAPGVGRLLFTSVVNPTASGPGGVSNLWGAQTALGRAYQASLLTECRAEALMTSSDKPWNEIARLAREHDCESMLFGLGLDAEGNASALEACINACAADAVVLQAPPDWSIAGARRILIPVGGRGLQSALRARILGNLRRTGEREFTFLRVLPTGASEQSQAEALRETKRLALIEARGNAEVVVIVAEDVAMEIGRRAPEVDAVILGIRRMSRGRSAFGSLAMDLARSIKTPLLLVSQR